MLNFSTRNFTTNPEHADQLRYNQFTSAFSSPTDRHRADSVIDITGMRNEYHAILKKYNLEQDLELVKCFGEKLTEKFGPQSFDLVWMQNALDHSQSPQIVFAELVSILRPGGYLVIQGQSREGTTADWSGLHQHDLYVAPGGRLMCESKFRGVLQPPICLNQGFPLILVESSAASTDPDQWTRFMKIVWQKSTPDLPTPPTP